MIVAIANQKGGVGKTTTAINLAAALALRGKPTLLIDLDPQVPLEDVVVASSLPGLSVAPSRIALAKVEAKLVGEMDAHFRLKDKIEPVRGSYPHIVIDCPPALG